MSIEGILRQKGHMGKKSYFELFVRSYWTAFIELDLKWKF